MKKIILFLSMLIVALGVYAQSEWEYHIGLGGELKNGNVNTVTIRNNAEVERDDSLLAFDAGYGIVYGKMEKEVYDKSFSAQVKVDIWQYDRWSPFMSLNYLNNKFKGFEYRISGLIGLKYRILMDDNYDYSISAAYVQDYTDYGEYSSTLEKKVYRLSLRFKMYHRLTDNLSLKHVTFWQPSLMRPMSSITNDYVVSSITSLSTKITSNISFDMVFDYEYHSLVPDGVKQQDIVTSILLRLDL